MIDILLVEDQMDLASLMEALLIKKGFSLYHARSGEEALSYLETHKIRVILLDIMLENMDGFSVCKKIREKESVPILMLSAKTEKSSKILSFELGADDYMEKPVDLDILCAKIRALLNRFSSNCFTSGDVSVEIDTHRAYLKGKEIELSSKEFALLSLLIQNKGKTLHKSYLFRTIWGDSFSEEQTLTVHIKHLRSKIEEDPKNPKKIVTVWGVGYRYEEI